MALRAVGEIVRCIFGDGTRFASLEKGKKLRESQERVLEKQISAC